MYSVNIPDYLGHFTYPAVGESSLRDDLPAKPVPFRDSRPTRNQRDPKDLPLLLKNAMAMYDPVTVVHTFSRRFPWKQSKFPYPAIQRIAPPIGIYSS